jgi:hypothetical protein
VTAEDIRKQASSVFRKNNCSVLHYLAERN